MLGCAQQSQTKSSGNPAAAGDGEWLIVPGKSFGKITKENATLEGVRALYGDQVREDSVFVAEGFWLPGLIVFPDQANEIQIGYEPEQGSLPTFIRTWNEDSDWKTAEGIAVGSSLAEVENANGTGLSFLGFGWDYGGTVTEWYGGKLEGLMMTLSPATEDFNEKFFGSKEFGTLDPDLPKDEVRVASIAIRF